MNLRFPRLVTAALVGILTVTMAAPAIAQTDTAADDEAAAETGERSLPGLKALCQRAIDQRLGHLAAAQARIDDVAALTDAHEATIDGIIDRTEAGLTQLRSEIEASTDRATTVELCARIAPVYRVYLVVLPQAHLTVAADRSQAAADIGYSLLGRLDEAIAKAEAAGADVTDAQAYADEAQAYVAAADEGNNGVAEAVLAVTPDSYNTGDGEAVLDAARADMRRVHEDLVNARSAARSAVKALRDALGALA